ncbi:MAG: nitroreductase family protein [candidate division Zixibacteria bacterium]|nr:nitroreductase family protein [candidate division Zixibacteria bacterium]
MKYPFIPYSSYKEYSPQEMKQRAKEFYDEIRCRKTVREFSDRTVPREIIENCLLAAGTAPNGANLQPWHFVVVSDKDIKSHIRIEAEKVEKDFYDNKITDEWRKILEPLGTDEHKPYLEIAPYLIIIFERKFTTNTDGSTLKNYYVPESVGIATGILITALHHAGLATLTHTPSPMGFLNKILNRPTSERPFLVLVVGYPADGAMVPDIKKHALDDLATFL